MRPHKNLLPASHLPMPIVEQAETLVIKVGSSLVTNDGKGLDRAALARWAAEIAQLMQQGKQIILVSSGAIAEGVQRLGWSKRPTDIHALQAAAAVGQMGLAQAYETSFQAHGIATAQILLTHADLADRLRYLNARATLSTLLDLKVLPIINENDTVITDEIKVGDNDTLGSLVTNLIEADALIILTDQVGLYTEDPRKNPAADFIEHALATDPQLTQMAGGAGTSIGKGGMLTKVYAAQRAARSGASTVIACGREPNVLTRLAAGESIGTSLHADMGRISARKQWMADHLQLKGEITLDAGAVKALREDGKSLLAIGVVQVSGQFNRGDVVSCIDRQTGQEIARGLIHYSAAEMRLIAGKPSHQIVDILGATNGTEIIHRDNMVLLQRT